MAALPGTADSQASIASQREFHFTADDFERVRQMIYKHAGISLAPVKKDMVYSRLVRRLRTLNLKSFSDYLTYLEKADEAEWEVFVNALTTNLTSFFRENHHFEILMQQLRASRARPYRIWCTASPTGEEPYSLAIAACEAFDTLSPPVQIMASDIDTNVLKTASQGVYPIERVDKLSSERLRKFFQRGSGKQEGYARVRPELQKLISFERINLLDARYPMNTVFDAIFCRNVMIYFDKETQYQILKKFKPHLVAGGFLYAGHSESFMHAADLFHSRGRTVYEHAK